MAFFGSVTHVYTVQELKSLLHFVIPVSEKNELGYLQGGFSKVECESVCALESEHSIEYADTE
jgi:hypothetical protein